MNRKKTAEMSLFRAVAGYRMADRKRDEDMREELRITDTSTVIRKLSKQVAGAVSKVVWKQRPEAAEGRICTFKSIICVAVWD
jgi:hypothetical protein